MYQLKWGHRVVDLPPLIHRSLSMLHRLEELDLGNNELYSLVGFLVFGIWRTSRFLVPELPKQFKIPWEQLSPLIAQLEEKHLLSALALSCNPLRTVKRSAIYWPTDKSQCGEMKYFTNVSKWPFKTGLCSCGSFQNQRDNTNVNILYHNPAFVCFHFFRQTQPESIGHLVGLKDLWLDGNQLNEIPAVSLSCTLFPFSFSELRLIFPQT